MFCSLCWDEAGKEKCASGNEAGRENSGNFCCIRTIDKARTVPEMWQKRPGLTASNQHLLVETTRSPVVGRLTASVDLWWQSRRVSRHDRRTLITTISTKGCGQPAPSAGRRGRADPTEWTAAAFVCQRRWLPRPPLVPAAKLPLACQSRANRFGSSTRRSSPVERARQWARVEITDKWQPDTAELSECASDAAVLWCTLEQQ